MKIALIAHDGKKAEMVSFVMHNHHVFKREDIKLCATGTTGSLVEQAGLRVEKLLSGPKGGDAQIAALAATGEVDLVIFFLDPMDVHPHQVDVSMLLRICNVHNVPLATNAATAEMIIKNI